MSATTKTLFLSAAVALVTTLPMAALADGHTSAHPGNKGYVGHVVKSSSHKAHHGHKYARRVVKKKRPREILDVPACPPNYFGMYRGTMYCSYGKLLR